MNSPLDLLEDECLNTALLATIESGNPSPSNAGRLILRGANNIDLVLTISRRLKQHAVTAALLIIKAAMVNDRILVLKLYGENVQGQETKIPFTEEDNIPELHAAVCGKSINTCIVISIEISRRNNAPAVREELLLRTGVDKSSSEVLWFGLRLMQLEISWLKKIYWVKTLRLASNELSFLPLDMASFLKQCIKLDLQQNKLCEIPQSLLELPSLKELNLSHNALVNIPDVPEWSASLLVLDLSNNHLSNLPETAVAAALSYLNISNNRFRTVPRCVCSFINLTALNIANNPQIVALPSELGRLKNLFKLNLDGLNNLNDPPKSVRTTAADCIRYLKSRLHSARGYYRMKMMLVGKQAMGKTTLVARLHNKDIGNESTVGVDVSEWKYAPALNRKTFHFSIWDFAGQEEYYATHQCFLSKHSLYLLMWKVTEGDAGIADLKPWLNNISMRAPGSSVIVVGTHLDKVSKEDKDSGKIDNLLLKVEELTNQYHHLNVAKITVIGLKGHMENVNKLKDYIYNAAAEYKVNNHCVMGQKIPSSYHTLDDKLSTIHHLVKEGKHEPIMHTAEFVKMVRDLSLTDIQDDDELCTVTRFLHEVGSLLHYEDRKHNLDDLYFVDPRWLCDLMSTVVTVKERNPYVKQGVLRSKNIPLLFKDKRFPYKYFNQYLTLLNRFEIALPLDKDYKRILIPSMLPVECPHVVPQLQPHCNNCYKRFILFSPTIHEGQNLRCLTPPGLWSRLLSRIMNTVKEIKNMLSEQIPDEEDDLIISTNIYRDNATSAPNSVSEELPDRNSGSSNEAQHRHKPLQMSGSVAIFSTEGGGSLVYWSTGLVYNLEKLTFSIQSLAENTKYHNKDGILILASQGVKGCRIFGQLIDIVEKLISEWYPGLSNKLEQRVPCSECLRGTSLDPCEFKVEQLIPLVAEHKLSYQCNSNHTVQLIDIVPELLLADLDPAFFLDCNDLIYKRDKNSISGTEMCGDVISGKYKNQSVTIKLFTTKDGFKELRSESKVLQQLYHPCLVCMVGVTVNPTLSLVLEEAPEGSLETPLLIEQREFPRIVFYRIAVQVASALRFLHSINIIFRNLKADNVLLWSLSPDHLINCKVADFNIAAHTDPGGIRGLHGTKGFIAPEVSHINHAKEHSVYDHQADIFSFGMFLYQLVAHRHPFHRLEASKIEPAIEEGKRPELEDVSIAEVGLYYMTRVMKLCWAGDPAERPTSQQIIEWLSAPALQLIVSVVPFNGKNSICNGCIVSPVTNNEARHGEGSTSSELWICFDGVREGKLNVLNTNTMQEVSRYSFRENQICCMKQCGQYVWVSSRTGVEYGVVNIFNKTTKDLIYSLKIKENTVSCITDSNHQVYLGTEEGNCFVFPIDVSEIQNSKVKSYCKYVSEYRVDDMALSKTSMWVSIRNQIHFFNSETLEFEGLEKRKKNTQAFVGKMMLSDNGDMMWSAHLRGVILSAWNAHECTHITDVDVGVCAEEKCYIDDYQDRIMTAMCIALDTVWVGLSSGYVMVFAMYPPEELLTYFRPYSSYICFFSASKYPGPCGKEECMMLCGGKMYQPDNSFKDLPDYAREGEKGKPVGTAGVAVLWEVLPAKYTRQVQYLGNGRSWLNYSTLEKTISDTGFTESLQYRQSKLCSSSEIKQ